MSQEQVTDHVYRNKRAGDDWCEQCGLPEAAHQFFNAADMARWNEAQRAPEQPK